jgi:SAM-dependent methyltransferase
MDVMRRNLVDTGLPAVQQREARLLRLRPILRCPVCCRSLSEYRSRESLGCGQHRYEFRFGVPVLLDEGPLLEVAKSWEPPRSTRLRDRIWRWIPGPTNGRRQTRLLREFLGALPDDAIVLNVGSGGTDLGSGVFNLDLFPYRDVDIACDTHNLPFENDSIDAVISTGMLQYAECPTTAVAEFFRVLKFGGKVFCTVPFLQGYSEDTPDLYRWTANGLDRLFVEFANRKVRPSHGAGSAFAWIAAQYLAAVLSLGNAKLHSMWLMVTRCLLAPFKWTDALTEGWPGEHTTSSAMLIVAEKPKLNQG